MTRFAETNFSTWLIFSCFLLFPFSRTVELPMLVMAIAGGIVAYRQRKVFWNVPAVRLFTLLFACIWLPMLFSIPDSYDLKSSAGTALPFLRLYLAGLFIIWAMADQDRVSLLVRLLAALTAMWVIDALYQAVTGHNFLGYAQVQSRLNGVFGDKSLKLGNALPVLAPFLLLALRRQLPLMLLAAIMTGVVVILAGSRGGWISYGLVCVWLLVSETKRRGVPLWKTGVVASLVVIVAAFAAFQTPNAKQRLDQTLLIFSTDEAKIDQALSLRWSLWKTALAMAREHPVNGVGVRAFRYAYPEFAQPGDPFSFVEEASGRPTGAFYAHQIVIEVLTETGLTGLFGLGLFYALLISYWRRAKAEFQLRSLPFAMAAMAWLFPINTHTAFFSAQWSVFSWLLIALLCATLLPLREAADGGAAKRNNQALDS